MSPTAPAHLELANWCARVGLKEEARVHLLYAANARPTDDDAQRIVKKLDQLWKEHEKQTLVTQAHLKEEAKESKKLAMEWKVRLTDIQRALEGRDPGWETTAIDRLRAIQHASPIQRAAAIPACEMLIAKSSASAAQIVIDALAAIPDQTATDALLRSALAAPHEQTRHAAAQALKQRSVFGYVPTLMNCLEPLVQVRLDLFQGESYRVGQTVYPSTRHRLWLFQEGRTIAREFQSWGGTSTGIDITHSTTRNPNGQVIGTRDSVSATEMPDVSLASDLQLAVRELAANRNRQEINQHVTSVLRATTGALLDSTPQAWWSWWSDYNEMYEPPQKPVARDYRDTTPQPFKTTEDTVAITIFPIESGRVDCVPAGTSVQTSTGPIAIEQVRTGDCVLSQDPDTGELAFKPVLATTMRPPSPLIHVRVAGETIRATRGHPFWVSGIGWQMAKELKAGQWLHTLGGPVLIERCEQNGSAEAYSLVVADFNSFFVGNVQALVHDNNLRQVTSAKVPGFVDLSPQL
ncbi:MAG TPA: polymorphic toxin-type HINT domain-containing protein [Pirellulales bacterium]|nr:polymorphic toxin-type HINT domain-containing protein [Pirellulales bacterium]